MTIPTPPSHGLFSGAISEASTSKKHERHLTGNPDEEIPMSTSQLRIPFQQPQRRSSLESVFTELSELSVLSNEHVGFPLTRKTSTSSDTSEYSAYSASSRQSLRQRLSSFYDQNYGALLVLISQFFGSLMNVFTRLLEHDGAHGPPMHPFQILFARQSLTAISCTIYALTTRSIPHFPFGPPDREVRLLLICRGLTGFFGVFGIYFSLLYLPLSEATVLTFLAPILACYLCTYVIPGETFTRQQQIAGFVSLVGVVFIAQPLSLFASSTTSTPSTSTGVEPGLPQPSSSIANNTLTSSPTSNHHFVSTPPTPSQHLLAIGIAMLGVCGATGAITSIRAIGTRAHAFISVNYFSVWSSIVSLVALLVIPSVSFRLPGNLTEWGLLFSLGTCGFVMQGLLTMGLAYKATGKGGGSGQPKVERHENIRKTSLAAKSQNSTTADIELATRPTSTNDATSSPSSSYPTLQTRSTVQQEGRQPERRGSRRKKPSSTSSTSSGTKATSMLYTQMLFALAGDRIVFGTSPGAWSWVGSALILGGAIWVASAKDNPSASDKSQSSAGDPVNDTETILETGGKQPEERVGLLNDVDFDDETLEAAGRHDGGPGIGHAHEPVESSLPSHA